MEGWMIRITALHGHPDDPDAFDRHYRDVHTPIVQSIPGVRNVRYGKTMPAADGRQPPYYLVCDTYFDDSAALEAALRTPEMKAALDDVPNFSTGGVTIMFGECEDFAPLQ
jgi:uncharacterized protein (TIGR02118 family)